MFNQETFWWQKENKPHQEVFTTLKKIKTKQNYRYIEFLNHMRLYGQTDIFGIESPTMNAIIPQTRPQVNIIQICCNTLVSKIGKTAPKVTFLTDDGDFSKQNQAQKLTAFSQGQFYRSKTYKQTPKALLDSSVFGMGIVKNYIQDKEIITERVLPFEIITDDKDSIYGNPRCLYHEKLVNKEVAKAMFPDFAKEIDTVETTSNPFGMTNFMYGDSEMVSLVECWHLPSSSKSKDGKHFIGIGNATLLYEDYKKDYFPFSFIKYQEQITGFWGDGVAKLLQGIQLDLNRALKRMSQAINIMSVPRILYEMSSKVVKQHFNNDVGSMIGYSGTPPTFINAQSIASDMFSWVQFLIDRAFQEIGISQMSASGLKPSGLNSKVALREFNDIETERFASFAKAWEDFHLDIAKQQIDLAKELAKQNANYGVWSKKNEGVEYIKWSEIDLKDDSYVMQAYPTSLLGQTPAGKLDKVTDLISLNMLSPEEASELLDFPDIKSVMKFKNAPINDIKYTIDAIVEKGEFRSPEPFQNLATGISYMQNAYLYYKNRNLDEDKLDLMRRWVDEALMLQRPPVEEMAAPLQQEPVLPEAAIPNTLGV